MLDGHKLRVVKAAILAALMVAGRGGLRAEDRPAWQTPPVVRMVSARQGETRKVISWGKLLDSLAEFEFVFLGETHTDETTHRVELAVYREMADRRDKQVVLAMEMFERDVQPVLDEYLSEKIDEATFVRQARVWGNYGPGYRPLIEFARRQKLPVVASNFPRPLLRKISAGGEQAWKQLKTEHPELVPERVLPHTAEYWQRVDNAIRGHLASMRLPTDPAKRLWTTQSLWDNTMAESCVRAARRYPGSLVLHVNGGFHSAYGDGTVRQLKLRLPSARVATVAIVPALSPLSAEPRGKPIADYVIYVESRARDENDGRFGVTVGQDRAYKLMMPEGRSRQRVPLVIYLVDDGLTEDDGVALLRSRFGDRVAIAVVAPTIRERAVDGSRGGRWFEADSFASDLSSSVTAVERVWGYLCRRFPVDPQRVVVVGEGTGATVAVAVGVQTDRMSGEFIGILPRRYAQLKDLPVPLKSLWGEQPMPRRTIRVIGGEDQAEWWNSELQAYGEQGIGTQFQAAALRNLDFLVSHELGKRLEAGKGQQETATPSAGWLVIDVATPRAQFFGRLQALWHHERTGDWLTIVRSAPQDRGPVWRPVLAPELFREPGTLPLCPGPFGGTTVVLAEGLEEAVQRRWLDIEEHDPIAGHSRFHRLRVATSEKGRTLPEVLAKLRRENRRNVLIVPAEFAASPAAMWEWQQQAAPFEDTMTIRWEPGLGGRRVEGLLKPVSRPASKDRDADVPEDER